MSIKQDIQQFELGAASRDAEISGLRDSLIQMVLECIQLREQLASRDAEVATLKAEKFEVGNNQTIFIVRIAELREQVTLLRDELEKYRGQVNQYGKHTAAEALSATEHHDRS